MISWLPEKFPVEPWNKDTYEKLYDYFCKNIRDADLFISCFRVWFYRGIDDGKEKMFWHLIGKKDKAQKIPRRMQKFEKEIRDKQSDRLPDIRRAERITWLPAVLENYLEPEVIDWEYIEADREIRRYLWIKDENYLIVLKNNSNDYSYRLVTAYYIRYNSKRRALEKKFQKRIK